MKINKIWLILLISTYFYSECVAVEIFSEKSKNEHQILILIPENDFAKNDNQSTLRIDSEINIKIFRNKSKPVFEVTKNLNCKLSNRISENVHIPLFISPKLKGGYYRFTITVFNKKEDSKREYKKIVLVPRKSIGVGNIYLFAIDNGVLIAPTIPIFKKNNYL